jgi:hypothetical protein
MRTLAPEQDIFTADEYRHLRRAAARIVEMWDNGRHVFCVDDLVDEAWLYKRVALLSGKTFIARKLLWKHMLLYVSARVFDGMPSRKHWTYQTAWERWLAPVIPASGVLYVDEAEFLDWITKGLTPHEATVVWRRLRESGKDRRWKEIARQLDTTVHAVKFAYSRAIRKLRRHMAESLEGRLSAKSLNERDRAQWKTIAIAER